jgi:hypothetical protein
MLFSLLLAALWAPTAIAADATTLELESGNNLLSFSVLPNDPTIEETLSGVDQDVVFIKGESVFASLEEGIWVGNIDQMEHTRGYWVNLNLTEPTELEILGRRTDPDIAYQLHAGHNLISFPCHEQVDVQDAFPSSILSDVESVSTAGMIATQINGSWQGSLSYLSPNIGYTVTLLQDAPDMQFMCPNADGSDPHFYGCMDTFATNYDPAATVSDKTCTYNVPTDWAASPFKSEAFYFLNDVRLDGEPLDPEEDAVGAFQGSTFLGFGYTRSGWTTIAALEGDPTATVQFKVYDASEETIHDLTLGTEPNFTDGFTSYGGCMDPEALNYTELAEFNIGNCMECEADLDCEDSGSACAPNVCDGGTCTVQPLDCDDGDACTEDLCNEPGECDHQPIETGECATTIIDPAFSEDEQGCSCVHGAPSVGWAGLGLFLALLWRERRLRPKYRAESKP